MDDIGIFYPKGHQSHARRGHPERPERVEAVREALERAGIWKQERLLEPLDLDDAVLEGIHTPRYLEELEQASSAGRHLDLDTYTTTESWELALQAAGGAAAAAEAVWEGRCPAALALTRPPGHHARPDQGMGFCLLNNAALAAEHLVQNHGAERLAVVDIDLHHGNGTQDIFWTRGDVLYLSTHQHPFYPGTGSLAETGAGAGEGLTVNLPLPAGSGDRAFQAAADRVLLPALDHYQPEMVLVSYGYDAHFRDPLGGLLLSADGYYRLIAALKNWAERYCAGQVAVILEGGYDLEAGQACTAGAAAALLDESWEDPLGPAPSGESSGWEPVVEQAASRF